MTSLSHLSSLRETHTMQCLKKGRTKEAVGRAGGGSIRPTKTGRPENSLADKQVRMLSNVFVYIFIYKYLPGKRRTLTTCMFTSFSLSLTAGIHFLRMTPFFAAVIVYQFYSFALKNLQNIG